MAAGGTPVDGVGGGRPSGSRKETTAPSRGGARGETRANDPGNAPGGASVTTTKPLFLHERLLAYQFSREFYRTARTITRQLP